MGRIEVWVRTYMLISGMLITRVVCILEIDLDAKRLQLTAQGLIEKLKLICGDVADHQLFANR